MGFIDSQYTLKYVVVASWVSLIFLKFSSWLVDVVASGVQDENRDL